jgi:hypothetical protein
MRIVLAPLIALYGLLLGCLIVSMIACICMCLVFVLATYMIYVSFLKKNDIPGWAEQFSTWMFDSLDYLGDAVNFLFVGWRKLMKAWKDEK